MLHSVLITMCSLFSNLCGTKCNEKITLLLIHNPTQPNPWMDPTHVHLCVRPLVEHDSVIWSPYIVKDIEHIESVQRRFAKRLPGFGTLPYADRLRRLNLPNLELRRLRTDLIDLLLCLWTD